jgi:predicted Rossmann fold nucleotide-binding protein DprA/Smf involved in DNA uptake
VADFLDAKVREIEERLQELRPLIDEFHRLEAASAALVDASSPRRRSPRPAAAPAAATTNGNRRGRPRGARSDNTRATQTVELVRAQPGITIPELASHMGIKPNYLYRVLPQLADEGKVRRDGKGWHAA